MLSYPPLKMENRSYELIYPDIKEFGLSILDALLFEFSLKNFGESLRAAARGLWRGEITMSAFIDSLFFSLDNFYELAWREGESKMGIKKGERTNEEEMERLRILAEDLTRVKKLALWIVNNSKELGTPWKSVADRVGLWQERYKEIVNLSMQMSGENQKLEWMLGATEKHCSSCLKLNGKVKRASFWKDADIRPKMRSLECKGYRCDCRFKVTDAPLTRGPLPQIP